MLLAILTLMGCQLVGEVLRDALGLPIPGPVIGLFLLATILVIRGRRGRCLPPALEATADTLVSHMGLLFVPAGVGIVTQAGLLRQQWLPIVAAVIVSTSLSLAVTGSVMQAGLRLSERRGSPARPLPGRNVRSC